MSSLSTISKSPVSNQYKIATKIKTNSSEPSDFSFFKNPSKYAISKKPTKVSKPDANIVVPTLNASKYDVGTYFSKVKTLPPTEIKDLLENVFALMNLLNFQNIMVENLDLAGFLHSLG